MSMNLDAVLARRDKLNGRGPRRLEGRANALTDLQRAYREYVAGRITYTAYKQAIERDHAGLHPGIVPFEFWLDGMKFMREIDAGPCCFAIHAPGKALDVGTWVSVLDVGTWAEWGGGWSETEDVCPWAPHYPPRAGTVEDHLEQARRLR